jgi:hypothetical protein
MKTKIHANRLDLDYIGFTEIPTELVQSVANLYTIEPKLMREIEKENIEAIGVITEESFYAYDYSDRTHGTYLDLFLTPLVASEMSCKPLNPTKTGQYSWMTLGSLRKLHILKEDCIKITKPSLIERCQSKKRTVEIEPQYGLMDIVNDFQITLKPNQKIIPIYDDNQDYQRIMEFVNSQKK